MKATLLLADAASAVDGKLYILGGGWSHTGSGTPFALAVKVEVPWAQANDLHELKLELLDADGTVVRLPSEEGPEPVVIGQTFETGRPPGLPHGTPIDHTLAITSNGLPLTPGHRFVWRLSIDDQTNEQWECGFYVRPQPSSVGPVG